MKEVLYKLAKPGELHRCKTLEHSTQRFIRIMPTSAQLEVYTFNEMTYTHHHTGFVVPYCPFCACSWETYRITECMGCNNIEAYHIDMLDDWVCDNCGSDKETVHSETGYKGFKWNSKAFGNSTYLIETHRKVKFRTRTFTKSQFRYVLNGTIQPIVAVDTSNITKKDIEDFINQWNKSNPGHILINVDMDSDRLSAYEQVEAVFDDETEKKE